MFSWCWSVSSTLVSPEGLKRLRTAGGMPRAAGCSSSHTAPKGVSEDLETHSKSCFTHDASWHRVLARWLDELLFTHTFLYLPLRFIPPPPALSLYVCSLLSFLFYPLALSIAFYLSLSLSVSLSLSLCVCLYLSLSLSVSLCVPVSLSLCLSLSLSISLCLSRSRCLSLCLLFCLFPSLSLKLKFSF